MGYASYDLEDGHGMRGYAIEALCRTEGCREVIDKGLAYLCYSCTKYFCPDHLTFAEGNFQCFAGESFQVCFECRKEEANAQTD